MLPVAGRLSATLDKTNTELTSLVLDHSDLLKLVDALATIPLDLKVEPIYLALKRTLSVFEQTLHEERYSSVERQVRAFWSNFERVKAGPTPVLKPEPEPKPTRAPNPVPTVIGRQYEDGRVRYVDAVLPDKGFSFRADPAKAKVFRSRNAAHNAVRDRMRAMEALGERGAALGKFTDFFTRPASEVVGVAPVSKFVPVPAPKPYLGRQYIPGCPCPSCVRKRYLGAK